MDSYSRNDSLPARFRLGIVLDSAWVPGWAYYLIDRLTSCTTIDAHLIYLSDRSKATSLSGQSPVLFRLWAALDRWARQSRTNAIRLRDCRLLLKDRSISILRLVERPNALLSGDDIARIKAANLDLLLDLGSATPRLNLSAYTRLGTWSVQNRDMYGTPAISSLFWDMYDNNPVTLYGPRVVVQKNGITRVVCRSSVTTNLFSLALNQDAVYWDIAHVLMTQLSSAEHRQISAGMYPESSGTQYEDCRTLDNKEMIRFAAGWALRMIRNEIKKHLFRDQWSIALQSKDDSLTMASNHGFRIMRPPRDRFYADPFLFERDGHNYLFFEDYRFSTQKGIISCCEIDIEGNVSKPRVVLERDYHLSYPFLFGWKDAIYMIPETRENGTIEIYRASHFPDSWVYEETLMSDITAMDSTLLYHRDKWWLFTAGILDQASPEKTLCLFFAESPLGPWTAHPKNPIVSDVRHARPAGCLYFDNGQLVRPGQDCSKEYGYATHLHRVNVLSETDYQETPVASITPDWIPGSHGIHTFNQNAQFRVIDCKFRISRFSFDLFPASEHSEARFSNSFACAPAKCSR